MKKRILVTVFAFNEGSKIRATLERFPRSRDYDLLVMDDGSTDGSLHDVEQQFGVKLLSNAMNMGVGASLKRVFDYALANGYEILVPVAGNNKDDPREIPLLLRPILEEGYDFVQGSRYMKGGRYGKMPFYRIIGTKVIHPLLFSLVSGKRVTESTNGFRAFRLSLLKDSRIDWRQKWLDKYELEPYLLYKAIKLGYRHKEVPVTKIYPSKELGYTKMKPITGWWSILKPLVWLGLGLKK